MDVFSFAARDRFLDREADLAQPGGDQFLATLIGRSDGTTGEKIPSQVKGLRHELPRPQSVRGYTGRSCSAASPALVTPL